MRIKFVSIVAAMVFAGVMACAGEGDPGGHAEYNGYMIVAASDIPPHQYQSDPGPVQIFEILRPGSGPITLSRLLTSCKCIQLEADKAEFGFGERAFVRLRNVLPTARKQYVFYVQVSSPESVLLKADAVVESYVPPAE